MLVAALVAVGAYLLLRPDDKSSNKATKPNSAATTPQPAPVQKIQVKGGRVVGGLATIKAKQGDTVRFQVSTDKPHEIHLHGYNVAKNATTTKPASFQLKATETGIFEIEIEDTSTQIAELRVEP